jgi:phosphate transport system substrate-binding protein
MCRDFLAFSTIPVQIHRIFTCIAYKGDVPNRRGGRCSVQRFFPSNLDVEEGFSMIRRLLAFALIVTASAFAQTISLTGAGSTFAYPLYSSWSSHYHSLHPNVEVNYQSIGSGGGIRQLIAGTVDFGATDGPMTDKELAEAQEKRGTAILHFPTALGADLPSYNIPGVTATLKFTPAALAGIYLGHITKWNDPAIQGPNPGVKLPASNIVVVHRSDGSGTTYCWVDYLSKVSPEWKNKVGVGTSVNWPVGLGGKGNEGVSGLIRRIPNSIGYIELIYAIQNHILYGDVQNSSGHFIQADLESVTAAAAGATKTMPADFRVSITNAPGATAYPISTYTWLLIPEKLSGTTKATALKAFLRWGLTDGQQYNKPLAYAPLPAAVVQKELLQMKKLQY